MEFLKIVRRRSFLHDLLYVVLNVALAIGLMVIIRVTGSLLPAFALVLMSMWRVLAVRIRFWVANIQANLVSAIVSFSFVIFLYITNLSSSGSLRIFIIQSLLVLAYIGWLLIVKPRSKRVFVVAQAGIALFVGITAIFALTYSWIATPVVLMVFIVGYSCARHVLTNYEETHTMLLSAAWGFVLAQIGWLAYHWTVAYRLPLLNDILLPQISVVAICFGFVSYKAYNSYFHYQKIRLNDIILPLAFSISIIGVLLLAFNGVNTSAI